MPIYAGGGVSGSVRITLSVYDTAGVLSDGGSVVCTITKPDGTTSTPTPVRDAEGEYHVDYYPALVGTYGVVWAVTGINAGSLEETFTVDDVTVAPPVSLAEVKAHLNMGSGFTDDEELRRFILAAASAVEARVGPLTRRSVTETHNGGTTAILLKQPPVISVTSVTENGTATTGYSLATGSGVLTRTSGYNKATWLDGFGNITVTYIAGRTSIPSDVRQGVLELVRHLWESQRGTMGGRPGSDDYIPGSGYTFPNRVEELLRPYMLPGVA